MPDVQYGHQRRLEGLSFEDALGRVTEALTAEGFGILTEIDVKDTLKKKLDVEFRRYKILGACNPPLAHKALAAEAQVGLLLPCNVVVQEDERGGTLVSFADPKVRLAVSSNPALAELAEDADRRLRRVLAAL
jgi:uncharacterized protein (DUF302 family)